VLLRSHSQLVVERVLPDLLHIIPVGHDAALDRVLEIQNSTLALGFVTNVAVFLIHAHHDTLNEKRIPTYSLEIHNLLNVISSCHF